MTFIRRSDGTVVYGGGHVGSRGSLESIKYGGAESPSNEFSEEDRHWEAAVLNACTSFASNFNEEMEDEEEYVNEILSLWGQYEGSCPHLKKEFNERFFSPSGR